MSIEATPEAKQSYDAWRDRRWLVTGRLLVLAWLLTAVMAVLTGEREWGWQTCRTPLPTGPCRRSRSSGCRSTTPRGAERR